MSNLNRSTQFRQAGRALVDANIALSRFASEHPRFRKATRVCQLTQPALQLCFELDSQLKRHRAQENV